MDINGIDGLAAGENGKFDSDTKQMALILNLFIGDRRNNVSRFTIITKTSSRRPNSREIRRYDEP
jgi:hypothetical protein